MKQRIKPAVNKQLFADDDKVESKIDLKNFRWTFVRQVILPLLLAGIGLVLAGLILEYSNKFSVFHQMQEIYILVPSLLGMKGNLEMTMISRMSSISAGPLFRLQKYEIAKANFALTQCQSIVTGLCAALLASAINYVRLLEFDLHRIVLLSSISILTSAIATFILGSLNFSIISWAVNKNINPDNIATPLAAAMGDVVTLTLLTLFGQIMYHIRNLYRFLPYAVIVISFIFVPFNLRYALASPYTKEASKQCWTPIILSMIISSLGGCILNLFLLDLDNVLVYQPLINGIGGNIAAIQASRLSTHIYANRHNLPAIKFNHLNPLTFLFQKDSHSMTALLLLLLSIPLHWFCFNLLNWNTTSTHLLLNYLVASILQIYVLLYLVEIVAGLMCWLGNDPDNSAIPYLTAIGDFTGTLFLFAAFVFPKLKL